MTQAQVPNFSAAPNFANYIDTSNAVLIIPLGKFVIVKDYIYKLTLSSDEKGNTILRPMSSILGTFLYNNNLRHYSWSRKNKITMYREYIIY